MMKKWISIALFIAIAAVGCANVEEENFSGSGTIEATEIKVSAKISGGIMYLSFEEGDRVKKGTALAEIDVEPVKLQRDVTSKGLDELDWEENIIKKEMSSAEETVKQASIMLENLKTNRDRIANLYKSNAVTLDRLDTIEAEHEIASSRLTEAMKRIDILKARLASFAAKREHIYANLRLLDNRIEDKSVISPTDGIITGKFVEQGELAAQGTPLCTVADLSRVWLTIYIDGTLLGKINIGSDAQIQIDSHPDELFNGKVTWISTRAEFTPKNVQTKDSRADLVYAVKISMDNPDGVFKIGMPADAFIEGL